MRVEPRIDGTRPDGEQARPSTNPVTELDSIEQTTANGSITPSAPIGTPRSSRIDGQATPSTPSGTAIANKARNATSMATFKEQHRAATPHPDPAR